jgi:VanZ family protein
LTRPVLLGGRRPLQTGSAVTWFVLVWVPVMIALAVIARESTNAFSSENTSMWIRKGFEAIFGAVSDERWPEKHHAIRKTGHFLGYGSLCLAWLRGWMLTWVVPLRSLSTATWRGYCVAMAIFCTMLTASFDELHQSFLPSRTGLVTDVWLDTTGASTLVLLVALSWLYRPKVL